MASIIRSGRAAALEGWPTQRRRPSRLASLAPQGDGLTMEPTEWAAYVYMLLCADGLYYVGSATGEDLSKRVAAHDAGAYPGYTFTRRPVRLVWSEHFERITDAIAVERKLKGWSRGKKEALVRSDWETVRVLSRRRSGRPLQPSS